MPYETLQYDKRNAIGYVTINRPDKLNAMNRKVMEELVECFQSLQTDDEVRVVILTGSGEKAFVAGADINELALLDAERNARERAQAAIGDREIIDLEHCGYVEHLLAVM